MGESLSMDAQDRMNEVANIVDLQTLIWVCICGLLIGSSLGVLIR